MKATDTPEVSKKWWTSEKPSDVKGSDLEKALQAAERALAEEKKNSDDRSIETCIAALADVCSAAEKTIKKELDKKKHKDCITVLEKYADLIKNERGRLEEAQAELKKNGEDDGEDEEESDEKIFEPDYVHKMIKLLKSTGKELNFGFGLNTKEPANSKLVITRKGKPERLFKALKKTGDFSNRLITYGTAMPDPQDGKTLVFKLAESAGEPPQVLKLGRRFLRSDKSLKFRKLKLIMPGGQTFEDTEPDTEEMQEGASAAAAMAGEGKADLSKELATAQNMVSAWERMLNEVSTQIDKLRKAVEGRKDPVLAGVSEGLGKVVGQFPDLDLSKLIAAAKSNDRAAYDRTLQQTGKEINDVRNLLAKGPLLSTIDENPFVATNVHATVNSTLDRFSKELGA
jgi:hypothetical protein